MDKMAYKSFKDSAVWIVKEFNSASSSICSLSSFGWRPYYIEEAIQDLAILYWIDYIVFYKVPFNCRENMRLEYNTIVHKQ